MSPKDTFRYLPGVPWGHPANPPKEPWGGLIEGHPGGHPADTPGAPQAPVYGAERGSVFSAIWGII